VPLIVYAFVVGLSHIEHVSSNVAFYISIATTGVTLFAMGAVKGRLTGSNVLTGGLTTFLFGALTAFVGWFIGFILDRSFPGVNVSF
jgi:VIT1/CCC1 family predicted Fe2+/Mn2+ transporter